jgi:hypothetical protein
LFPVFIQIEIWIKRLFTANRALVPIILLTQMYPMIAYAGGLWIVTIPLSSFLVMLMSKNH